MIGKGRFHEKKVAVLLDFVQMRGGRGVIWTKFKRTAIFFVNLSLKAQ